MNQPTHNFPTGEPANLIHPDTPECRILVVEWEGMTRLMLLRWLRLAGFQVDWARHESIAIKKLRSSSPDVLLLGLPMRVEVVIQLIQLARKSEHFADRPIFLYAATAGLNRALRRVVAANAIRLLDRVALPPDALVAAIVTDLWHARAPREITAELTPVVAGDNHGTGFPIASAVTLARTDHADSFITNAAIPSNDDFPDAAVPTPCEPMASGLGEVQLQPPAPEVPPPAVMPDASVLPELADPVSETSALADSPAVASTPPKPMNSKNSNSDPVADIPVTTAEINAAPDPAHRRPTESVRPGEAAVAEGGATFAPVPAEQAAAGASAAQSILLVEDDPFISKAYRQQLERAGYSVESVMDGLQAVERLPELRPSLVILDLMLPKLHGLEVLKFARADAQLKGTPILVLSNAFMGGLVNKALAAGATQGLLKTECTPRKLLAVVSQLLAGPADGPSPAESGSAPANGEESALVKARAELLAEGPPEIALLREDCLNYIRRVAVPEARDHLNSLYRRVRCLGGRATLCGCRPIGEFTSALEAVLFEMVFQTATPTDSILRTVAQAVDGLGRLLLAGEPAARLAEGCFRILVVDDDAVFTHTTSVALKRAHLNVTCVQDPTASLELMRAQQFDLVILDVDMPGRDGFNVCQELRQIPGYETTQVIFVTMHTDLGNRARSIVVGGDDFIGKPVSPLELALKVTIHLLDPGAKVPAAEPAGPHANAGRPAAPTKSTARRHRTPRPAVATEGETVAGTPSAPADPPARWSPAEPPPQNPAAMCSATAPGFEPRRPEPLAESQEQMEQLRAQLVAATATTNQAAQAAEAWQSRAGGLEAELATMRAQHDALTADWRRAQTESSRQVSELEQELQAKAAAFAAREGQLEATVSRVTVASKVVEADAQAWRERSGQMETELAALRGSYDGLESRTAAEQVESVERLTKLTKQLDQLRLELKETGAQGQQAQAEAEAWRTRCDQLATEAAALRQQQETWCTARQQTEHETSRRIAELEAQLQTVRAESRVQMDALKLQLAGEMASKAQLETQTGELNLRLQEADTSALRARDTAQQLCARLAATEAEASAARADALARQERVKQLESDLAGLQSSHATRQADDERALAQATQRAGELERALADAVEAAHQRLEDGRRELAAMTTAREQSEAGARQLKADAGQLANELTQLRNAHTELLARSTQDRANADQRLASLEKQSRQNQAAVRKQLQQAQARLMEATTAVQRLQGERQDWAARAAQLEADTAVWRTEREALLSTQRQAEQAASRNLAELETKLQATTAEASATAAALRRQLTAAEDAQRREQEANRNLQTQLTAAAAAGERAEAELATWKERAGQFAQEIAALQTEREASAASRNREQTESCQRRAELEKQLATMTTELTASATAAQEARTAADSWQARAEALAADQAALQQDREALLADRDRAEANARERTAALNQQLEQLRTELTQARKIERELKELRSRHEALRTRHSQARAEMRQRTAELEKQNERMRGELVAARATAKALAADSETWQARWQENEAGLLAWQSRYEELLSQSQRIEQEQGECIAGLEAKLAATSAESGMELAAVRQELAGAQQDGREWQRRLTQWEGELAEARTQWQQAVRDVQTWQTRSQHLETELAAAQNRHAEVVAESSQQLDALRHDLSETGRAREDSQRELANLQSELGAAAAARVAAIAEAQVVQERCRQLESEKQAWENLQSELLARSQKAEHEAGERIQLLDEKLHASATAFATEMGQMQQRLRQAMASWAGATTDLDRERLARQRGEQVRAELTQELEQLHAELGRQLAAGREGQALLGRTAEQLQQREGALAEAQRELQQATAGRELAETQLHESQERAALLEQRVALANHAQKVLHTVQAELESRIKASLAALHASESRLAEEAATCDQLAVRLETTHQQLGEAVTKCHRLETQLDAALQQTTHLQTSWEHETGERQRLNEALAAAQLQLREQSQASELDVTRLRSALELEQVERQRLHNYTARLRCVSQAASRAGRAVREEARRQVREPLEEVCRTARRLLQMELAADQNQLARQVLEHALLARTSLQDENSPPPTAPVAAGTQAN